ncbi:MAG: restriction endonuclease subunit S [Cyclobacteriaceae bacterium]|nr:restriction endonuclease subunit S [Cyclobacteriaceae bacterium]
MTDYVANGSFASLKANVRYLSSPDYAVLVRLTDHSNGWNGNYVYVSEKSYRFLKKSTVFPGDLIINNVGDTGKAFIVPNLGTPMTLGPNSILVRPLDKAAIHTNYIFHFIKSPVGQAEIEKISSATTLKKFNKTAFRKIEFNVPAYEDQLRIAEILSKAELLISQRKESIRLLDELLKSTFLEMFGDPFVGDNIRPLGEYLRLQHGYAFKSGDFVDSGIPVIKIGTINKGYFDIKSLSFLNNHFGTGYDSYAIKPGELLISLTGTVGKDDYANTCFVPNVFNFYLLNQRVAKLIPDERTLLKSYLDFLFKYPDFKRKLVKNNRGVRQANLSSSDIYSVKVNVPEISLQIEFSQIVEKTQAIKANYQTSLQELENLYGALSQRAFRGELMIGKTNVGNEA